MRQASYRDPVGRMWEVFLPEGVPDEMAPQGIPIGPPSLSHLGLPLELEVRLHNELHARALFTLKDVRQHPNEILAAYQAALKVDAIQIREAYTLTDVVAAP